MIADYFSFWTFTSTHAHKLTIEPIARHISYKFQCQICIQMYITFNFIRKNMKNGVFQ